MNEHNWLFEFIFVPGKAGPLWIFVGVGLGVLIGQRLHRRR